MKPGDLIRIKFAGHHLVGRTALVIDLNSGPYEGWLMILIDGKTIKVPDAWVEYETG
jgi:hypothetical protein